MKQCKDCKYYEETAPFYHPKCKKKIYYSICKKDKKLITRTCKHRAEYCKDYEEE